MKAPLAILAVLIASASSALAGPKKLANVAASSAPASSAAASSSASPTASSAAVSSSLPAAASSSAPATTATGSQTNGCSQYAATVAFCLGTPKGFVAGQPVILTWGIGTQYSQSTLPSAVEIDLLNNKVFVASIAYGVSPTALSYSYNVPSTLADGAEYSLRIGTGNSDWGYSSYFAVTGCSSGCTSTLANATMPGSTSTPSGSSNSSSSLNTTSNGNQTTTASKSSASAFNIGSGVVAAAAIVASAFLL